MSDAPQKIALVEHDSEPGFWRIFQNGFDDPEGRVEYLRARPGDLPDRMAEAIDMQARLIDDMMRFVGQMALQDYALLNEAPIKAAQVRREYDALEKGDG